MSTQSFYESETKKGGLIILRNIERMFKKAKKLNLLSYDNVIRRNLKVMDTTSITLAKENKIPIIVFSILQKDFLTEIIKGKSSYTIIKD